jgi:hypothetical protein
MLLPGNSEVYVPEREPEYEPPLSSAVSSCLRVCKRPVRMLPDPAPTSRCYATPGRCVGGRETETDPSGTKALKSGFNGRNERAIGDSCPSPRFISKSKSRILITF